MHALTNSRELARNFKPTCDQIRAARNLLLAKAHEQTVRPIVEGYESAILKRLQLKIARKYVKLGCADCVILDPKRVYQCEDVDRDLFYRETWKARDAAGFVADHPEHCPLLAAEVLRIEAESALLLAWSETPGHAAFANRVTTVKLREKAVDLVMQLLTPYVGNPFDQSHVIAAAA